MMVTWVRGMFTDIHGWLEFEPERAMDAASEGVIDATTLGTGEPNRDAHVRGADFFDVEHHPTVRFSGRATERIGDTHATAVADLTIRGTTRPVPLDVAYLGQWETPSGSATSVEGACVASASRPRPGSTATTSGSPGKTRCPSAASS
jgi:polyisoprenoid-binding protein YceI